MLGFGMARLPLADGDPNIIDKAGATEMLRYAIDNGVNYVEPGYPYDLSRHEQVCRFLGRIFQSGYREKVKVTAAVPHSVINSQQDFDSFLNRQLEWLITDKIDFCLLGGLNRDTWPGLQELGILKLIEKAKADGRVGNIGFSFHDHFMTLREITEAYDGWSAAQFQYSYMDVDHHPGIGGIRYVAEKGLAVIITEPLKWGRLVKEPPEQAAKIWAESPAGRSLAGWGLDWVWSHPEVATVVSDVSTLAQVKENVVLADSAAPDSFSISEQITIGKVRDAYRTLKPMPCTACRGCMPCPLDIDVPRIFEIYNDAVMYGDVETGKYLYKYEHHNIDICSECGTCAEACGFKLPIIDWLKKARELLG